MIDYTLLKKLCTAGGISGDEDALRESILDEIKDFADEIKTDSMGNLLAFKKGRKTPVKKLMLSAHMDEVGFIITHINTDGTLKFDTVGGINNSAFFAKQVLIGKNKIPGVICSKPVHLVGADDRKKCPEIHTLSIDIGAESKEEAEKYIMLGDSVIFDSLYDDSENRIISKALDDRFGCLVLIQLLKSDLEYDMYFAFCVQEEVGLRGSACAAFSLEPDAAIVIEATTAADMPYAEDEKKVCLLGEGAVVSFMDRATIYDKEYYQKAFEIGKDQNIKVQTKTMIAGGNDAGAIHRSKSGVRTVAVSVPCRYLHSSASMIFKSDAQAVLALVKALSEYILA